MHKLFVFIVIIFSSIFLFLFVNSSVFAQDVNTPYLTVSGKDLYFKGQKANLKGVNFDNIPALSAGIGTANILDMNTYQEDYQKLAQLGGNTARLGLDYGWYAANKTQFFSIMDQHVAWAKQNGIFLIFNIFVLPGNCYEGYSNTCPFWDNATYKTQLKNFWVDMATRYKNEPSVAGYDLVNEPTTWGSNSGSSGWYSWAEDTCKAINTADSNTHLVFFEAESDPSFSRKLNCNNLVYEVHFYRPMALTHGDATSTQRYPGTFTDWWNGIQKTIFLDKTAFTSTSSDAYLGVALPINWAANQNVPLFVGEWGSRATSPNYQQYVRDIAEIFRDWGVNHTYYTWRHDPNYWKWGIYANGATHFDLSFPEKLSAVQVSFSGAFRPNFTGTQPTTSPGPQRTATPSPSPTATPNTTTGPLTITTSLRLSQSTAQSGQTLTGTVTYKNNTASEITIDNLVIAARPPGGTNLGGPYLDFSPSLGAKAFSPGESYTFTSTRTFSSTDPVGQWYSYSTYNYNGQWYDAATNLNVSITVGGSSSTSAPTPTATGTPGRTGDANGDNTVDGADYVIWLTHYNQTTNGASQGDFNASGKTDGADYVLWLINYSTTSPTATPGSTATAIPTATPTKTATPTPTATKTASPAPTSSGAAGLKLQGTRLVSTTTGNRFIIKGLNVEFYRDSGCSYVTSGQYQKRTAVVAKIKSLNVNAIRLNYSLGWLGQNSTNLSQFLDMMQLFAQNGMYVMPSDHAYTGHQLTNRADSYPLFKNIIDGARARGIESYLIMNPYNEPYGEETWTWAQWVTANKDTLTYLRNTAGFKGVVALDSPSWAGAFDVASFQQVQAHDATLLGGTANVMFSNHWYPNFGLQPPDEAFNNSNVVPLIMGELGQINPGVTDVTPQYPKDVLSHAISIGIPNGFNGAFPWIWNWCDENSMTPSDEGNPANNDYVTLNTYGNSIVTSYYSKTLQ